MSGSAFRGVFAARQGRRCRKKNIPSGVLFFSSYWFLYLASMWLRSPLAPLTVFCIFAFCATVGFRLCAESLGWLIMAIPCASVALVAAYETWRRLRGR